MEVSVFGRGNEYEWREDRGREDRGREDRGRERRREFSGREACGFLRFSNRSFAQSFL